MNISARRTDPDTSHLAAHEIERSGHAASQRDLCLMHVRRHPGLTSSELAEQMGCMNVFPHKRLPELRKAGLIENGPARKCSVTGFTALTWIIKEPMNYRQGELL